MVLNVTFLQELLNTVAERGRSLLPRSMFSASEEDIYSLSRALLSGRGEASGVVLARAFIEAYANLDRGSRSDFFGFLASELDPDPDSVLAGARAYLAKPGPQSLMQLQLAVESPRQELFRRVNLAPGATAALVALRRDLIDCMEDRPELARVDQDLRSLFQTWFNRGFLVLRHIDWQTPAAILEKIIRYEAVHAIESWDDLRRRLDPGDRRCFAFFHPSLVDEPLIFVEVALTKEMPDAIAPVIERARPLDAGEEPTTAVFYSISNCQPGLKGISFGHFLIKQVVEDLRREKPSLTTFVTLSPVPGFAGWIENLDPAQRQEFLEEAAWPAVDAALASRGSAGTATIEAAKVPILALAANYFLVFKGRANKPVDPVARFHLGNGAELARINWMADLSVKGRQEALGLMVNYVYEIDAIEQNHEAYADQGVIAASRGVRALLKTLPRAKSPAIRGAPRSLPAPAAKAAGTGKPS